MKGGRSIGGPEVAPLLHYGLQMEEVITRSDMFTYPLEMVWADEQCTSVYVTLESTDSVVKINLYTKEITHVVGEVGGGNQDGDMKTAKFSCPMGISFAPPSTLFLADYGNNRLSLVDLEKRVVRTLAGGLDARGYADGSADTAKLASPTGVVWDPVKKVLYFAEYYNHAVRMLDFGPKLFDSSSSEIKVSTVFGHPKRWKLQRHQSLANPTNVTLDLDGNLLVADFNQHRVLRIDKETGVPVVLAGAYLHGFADGIGAEAKFHGVMCAAMDASGVIWVTDYTNRALRMLVPLDPQKYGPYEVVTVCVGPFATPRGIAIDNHRSKIYLTCYRRHTIVCFKKLFERRLVDDEIEFGSCFQQLVRLVDWADTEIVLHDPVTKKIQETLRVHSSIIKIRAPSLLEAKELTCSHDTALTLIRYIYTDFAAGIHLQTDKIIEELLNLSELLSLPRLGWLCKCAIAAKQKEAFPSERPPDVRLAESLHQLLTIANTQNCGDILLTAKQGAIKLWAHKIILAARSSYFQAFLLRFSESSRFKSQPTAPSSSACVSSDADNTQESIINLDDVGVAVELTYDLLWNTLQIIYSDELGLSVRLSFNQLQQLVHLLDFFGTWSSGIAKSLAKYLHLTGILDDPSTWLEVYKMCRVHTGLELLRTTLLERITAHKKLAYPFLLCEKDQQVVNEILLHVVFNSDFQ